MLNKEIEEFNTNNRFSIKSFRNTRNYYLDCHKECGINSKILKCKINNKETTKEENIENIENLEILSDNETEVSEIERRSFNMSMNFGSEFAKTFQNQVLTLCLNPKFIDSDCFYEEAKIKAKTYLDMKIGAYSCAKGQERLRANIASFMKTRDDIEPCKDEIFILNGGLDTFRVIISLISNQKDFILMPSPCFPLYLDCNTFSNINNLIYEIDIEYNQINVKFNYYF